LNLALSPGFLLIRLYLEPKSFTIEGRAGIAANTKQRVDIAVQNVCGGAWRVALGRESQDPAAV
jgi:hypothetical protein